MTQTKINQTPNWWITKLVSAFGLLYLISSLSFSYNSNGDKSNFLKTEHIILFSIILLFNSDLIEKIETFSFGDLSAKFASKEEVDKLSSQVDTLLLGTILDKFENRTIQAIAAKIADDSYDINPKGEDLLERLMNRELIEVKSDKEILKKHGKSIHLKDHFTITKKGKLYLALVESKNSAA